MTNEEYLERYLEPSKLEEGLKKLKEGLPVQYIIGDVDFYGNKIEVTPDTLIPRFETELLVSKTIGYINEFFKKQVSILDLGTGSGNIAITLKKKVNCDVTAVDISPKALDVAIQNASNNDVEIDFIESDMFSDVNSKYDVIISNPPYISYDEEIEDIVRKNEPAIALFAGNNGLEYYEKIINEADNYINKKALIAFEIGRTQGEQIKQLAQNKFPNSKVLIEKDLPGEDRFVFIFIGCDDL